MSDEIDVEMERMARLLAQKNRRINELVATASYVPHKEVNIQDMDIHPKYIFPILEKKGEKEMTKRTTTVKIFTKDFERLKQYKLALGLLNYAKTVRYILQNFPEMIVEEKGINPAPVKKIQVIDPNRGKDFVQIGGEKL